MLQKKDIKCRLREGKSLSMPALSLPKPCSLTPRRKPLPAIIRPGTSKRRSIDSILKSGAYEREKFKPRARIDREAEKKRLQNFMAFGDKEKVVNLKPIVKRIAPIEEEKEEINRFDQCNHFFV